jgi:hypothetical protein
MSKPTLTISTQAALRDMHPDPFVQAALWRLYVEAPGLLDATAWVKIATAQGMSPDQMMTARANATTKEP